jgi:hypothetical protein
MKERRWPWLVSGLALVLASISGAAATYLWWLPCRGRMLVGTDFGPRYSDALLGEECIDRMNEGTPFPLPTEAALTAPGLLLLSTVTMILVAVAWLVPVAALPVSGTARWGMALPGLTVLAVAVLGVGTTYGTSVESLGYLLDSLLSVFALVGLGVVLVAQVPGQVRFGVVTLSVSALGFAGMVADYMLMIRWSDADWDSPPGSGYLTAALLLLCGIAVLIMTALSPRPASAATAAQQVQQVDPVP